MIYKSNYKSKLGNIVILSDGENIIGLYFDDKESLDNVYDVKRAKEENLVIFDKLKDLLNQYFEGKNPDFSSINLKLTGTDFQKKIWPNLNRIKYGETVSYQALALMSGLDKNHARAVGKAVSKNPISIILPCHRVVGSDKKLVGYAGGIDRKECLLNLEKSS